MKRLLLAALWPLSLIAQTVIPAPPTQTAISSTQPEERADAREVLLRPVKQLMGTGSNAEACGSNNGKKIGVAEWIQ